MNVDIFKQSFKYETVLVVLFTSKKLNKNI